MSVGLGVLAGIPEAHPQVPPIRGGRAAQLAALMTPLSPASSRVPHETLG